MGVCKQARKGICQVPARSRRKGAHDGEASAAAPIHRLSALQSFPEKDIRTCSAKLDASPKDQQHCADNRHQACNDGRSAPIRSNRRVGLFQQQPTRFANGASDITVPFRSTIQHISLSPARASIRQSIIRLRRKTSSAISRDGAISRDTIASFRCSKPIPLWRWCLL